jgi:hypothetical protein
LEEQLTLAEVGNNILNTWPYPAFRAWCSPSKLPRNSLISETWKLIWSGWLLKIRRVTSQTTPSMLKWERTAGRYSAFCDSDISRISPVGVISFTPITNDKNCAD